MQNLIFLAQAVPEGRVFGLDSQTLISIGIQLFNAIVLAVALGYLLYNPVKEFMQNRTNRIQGKIDDAAATMKQANELIAEYDKKMQDIETERAAIIEAAQHRARDEGRLILEEAKQEAEAVMDRAHQKVAAEQRRLQEETRHYIIELASLLAEKYITTNLDDDLQNQLFEKTLAQMEETRWQN